MKRKILFAGIDGAGKSTSLDLLISKLDSKYKVLRIGYSSPCLFFRGKKDVAFRYDVQGAMESISHLFRKYHCYGVFLMLNFLVKHMLSKYLEIFKRCDLILYETDTLLHPAVHITFHFPMFKLISQKARLKIVSTLFGSKKTMMIIFLDVDPKRAMERIQKRGDPLDAHENPEGLVMLRTEFHKMITVAVEDGFNIVKISTDNKSPEEVVDEIGEALVERWLITCRVSG